MSLTLVTPDDLDALRADALDAIDRARAELAAQIAALSASLAAHTHAPPADVTAGPLTVRVGAGVHELGPYEVKVVGRA